MNDKMKVRTNWVPRHTMAFEELTPAEQQDQASTFENPQNEDYFRYCGQVYPLSDFMRVQHGGDLERSGWAGIFSTSAFSAIVVRYTGDCTGDIIVGSISC